MVLIAAPLCFDPGKPEGPIRVKCPLYLLSSRRAGRQRRVSTGISAPVNHSQRGWPTKQPGAGHLLAY